MEYNDTDFGEWYIDVEGEWKEKLSELVGDKSKAATEEQRTGILRAISANAMDFTKLGHIESVFFLRLALPRTFFYESRGKPSEFLRVYFGFRSDNLVQWLRQMYDYLGRAHNMLGFVVRTNLENCGYNKNGLGSALIAAFRDDSDGFSYPEGAEAIRSTLGHYINNPLVRSLARRHEDELYGICDSLAPADVGYLVRQFVLYSLRGKNAKTCRCGWLPLDMACICEPNLAYDPSKEYFSVLLRLVLQRRTGEFDRLLRNNNMHSGTRAWTSAMQNEFVQVACSNVLSLETYKEIRRTISMDEDITMKDQPGLPRLSPAPIRGGR